VVKAQSISSQQVPDAEIEIHPYSGEAAPSGLRYALMTPGKAVVPAASGFRDHRILVLSQHHQRAYDLSLVQCRCKRTFIDVA